MSSIVPTDNYVKKAGYYAFDDRTTRVAKFYLDRIMCCTRVSTTAMSYLTSLAEERLDPNVRMCMMYNKFFLPENCPVPVIPDGEQIVRCLHSYEVARVHADFYLNTQKIKSQRDIDLIVSNMHNHCVFIFKMLHSTFDFKKKNMKKNDALWRALFGFKCKSSSFRKNDWRGKYSDEDMPNTDMLKLDVNNPFDIPQPFHVIRRRFEYAVKCCMNDMNLLKVNQRTGEVVMPNFTLDHCVAWTSKNGQEFVNQLVADEFYSPPQETDGKQVASIAEQDVFCDLPEYLKSLFSPSVTGPKENDTVSTHENDKKPCATTDPVNPESPKPHEKSSTGNDPNNEKDKSDGNKSLMNSVIKAIDKVGIYKNFGSTPVPHSVLQEAGKACHEKFKEVFAYDYADYLAGETPLELAGKPTDPEFRKLHCFKHYQHKIDTGRGNTEDLSWHALHETVSPYFKEQSFEDANESIWTAAEDYANGSGKGKSRFTRIADKAGGNGFHLKSMGSRLLLSKPFTSHEEKIHNVLKYVMNLMDQAISEYIQSFHSKLGVVQLPIYRQRQLQMLIGTLIGASYSEHDDSSPTCVLGSDNDNLLSRMGHALGKRKSPSAHKKKIAKQGKTVAKKKSATKIKMKPPPVRRSNRTAKSNLGVTENTTSRLNKAYVLDHEQVALPTIWEMRVPTLTLCNMQNENNDFVNKVNYVAMLAVRPNNHKRPLFYIPCFSNTLHIQGFGAQQFTKHVVIANKEVTHVGNSRVVRLVISGRDPIMEGDAGYNAVMAHAKLQQGEFDHYIYGKVTDYLISPGTNYEIHHEESTSQTCPEDVVCQHCHQKVTPIKDSVKLTRPEKSLKPLTKNVRKKDSVVVLPRNTIESYVPREEDVDIYSIPKPPGYMKSKEKLDVLLLNGKFQTFMRNRAMVCRMTLHDGKSKRDFSHGVLPTFHTSCRPGAKTETSTRSAHSLKPGDIVSRSDLYMYYDIQDRHKTDRFIIHKDDPAMCTFMILQHLYKNGMKEIISAQKSFLHDEMVKQGIVNFIDPFIEKPTQDWSARETYGEDYPEEMVKRATAASPKKYPVNPCSDGGEHEIWVGASGGSAEVNGSNAVSCDKLPTDKNNIARATLPHPQDPTSPLKMILEELNSRNSILSLFVPARNCDLRGVKSSGKKNSSKDGGHSTEYFQYLGEYQFFESRHQQDNARHVLMESLDARIPKSDIHNLTFRCMMHWKFFMRRFNVIDEDLKSDLYGKEINLRLYKSHQARFKFCSHEEIGYVADDGVTTAEAIGLENWMSPHEKLLHSFFKTDNWKEYCTEWCCDDQESLEETEVAKGKRTIYPNDIATMAMHNMVSVSARALRMNVVNDFGKVYGKRDKGEPKATILFQDEFADNIGDVFRGAATPMAARNGDVTTAMFIGMWRTYLSDDPRNVDGITCDPGPNANYKFRRVHHSELSAKTQDDLLLTVVLTRITGLPIPWKEYFRRKKNMDSPSILSTDDCEEFLRFVNATCGGTWDHNMNSWLSEQMKEALPSKVISSPEHFSNFTKSLLNKILGEDRLFDLMLDASQSGEVDPRQHAVDVLKAALDDSIMSKSDTEKGKTSFLADNMMRDLEEILEDPAGYAITTHCGHGGVVGSKFISLGPNFTERQHTPLACAKGNVRWVNFMASRKQLDLISLYVSDEPVDTSLVTGDMSTYINMKNPVRHKLNGRLFFCYDGEHWNCKAYIASQYAVGTRSYNTHHLSRAHLHPTPESGVFHSCNDETYREIICVFREMIKDGSFPRMNHMFLLYHERSHEPTESRKRKLPIAEEDLSKGKGSIYSRRQLIRRQAGSRI